MAPCNTEQTQFRKSALKKQNRPTAPKIVAWQSGIIDNEWKRPLDSPAHPNERSDNPATYDAFISSSPRPLEKSGGVTRRQSLNSTDRRAIHDQRYQSGPRATSEVLSSMAQYQHRERAASPGTAVLEWMSGVPLQKACPPQGSRKRYSEAESSLRPEKQDSRQQYRSPRRQALCTDTHEAADSGMRNRDSLQKSRSRVSESRSSSGRPSSPAYRLPIVPDPPAVRKPPSAPRPSRLPTPDLSDIEDEFFHPKSWYGFQPARFTTMEAKLNAAHAHIRASSAKTDTRLARQVTP